MHYGLYLGSKAEPNLNYSGPALELGHLGLGEFDCELEIVVSELSFG